MKGDFSRFTFDPSKHYSGVLHQQGRVWLDSDWNEEVLERLALLQQELADVIGPAGTPAAGSGFELSPSADPNAPDDFAISAGHCYVNGILCQLEANTTYLSQPDLLDPPRLSLPRDGSTVNALVYLEVWQRLITYLEDDSIREIALGGPDTSARLKNIVQVKVKVLPSQQGPVTCAQGAQLLPTPGGGTLTTLQPTNVQPQNLCQLPDPANFTGRENHLYRVQVHDAGDVAGVASGGAFSVSLAASVGAGATSLGVSPALTAAQSSAALRNGFITLTDKSGLSERVALAPGGVSANGAALTLAQGLKNAFTTGNDTTLAGGTARFKWSRDNASFAVNVTDVQPDRVTLTVASLGRDVATALRDGDLVEISDDASELGPGRGHLTTLNGDPDPDSFKVVLSDPIPSNFVLPGGTASPPSPSPTNRHMILRRWDQIGDAASDYSDAGTPGMNLGDGVHIQFGGQNLCAGDYWQFTVRAADGSVQPLLNAPPAGINKSWAPLAVVSWGPPTPTSPPAPAGTLGMNIQSCLPTFPALIHFPPIDDGIHIVALNTVDANNNATQLLNDSNVQVNSFGGINVQCDTAVDPASISRPTCFVSVELPLNFAGGQASDIYYPFVLAGNVSCSGNVISWRPGAGAQTVLNQFITAALNDRGVLTHLTLKGDFIWSQNDPTLFLDGEVFGRPPGGNNNNVSLRLPSGDRRRGGDFEMWFWVVAAPSFITDIQATPSGPVNGGDTVTLTMTLSSQAPANSVITLTLSNGNVTIASEKTSSPPTSPPSFTVSVPVPTGATSVTVTATATAVGSTNITATFGQSVAITLVVQPAPILTGHLLLSPASVFVGRASTGTVTITGPAPSKGLPVNLTSSNPGIGKLAAASVTVPAGATTANFQITGVAAGSCTITASTTSPASSLAALFTVVQKTSKEGKETKLDKVQIEKITDSKALAAERLKVTDAISGNFADRALLAQGLGAPPQAASSDDAVPQRAAFIRAEERPPVGDAVINPPTPEEARAEASAPADAEAPTPVSADAATAVDLLLPTQKPADKALSPEKGAMPEKLGGRPTT